MMMMVGGISLKTQRLALLVIPLTITFLEVSLDVRQQLLTHTADGDDTMFMENGIPSDMMLPVAAAVGNLDKERDQDCPFRNSSIYRKVFVYPTPGDEEWSGSILSEYGHNNNNNMSNSTSTWPWVKRDRRARKKRLNHYNHESENAQFATELLLREIIINPKSCLRTNDPEEATLFYVPYLPSTSLHGYTKGKEQKDFTFTPHAKALLDAIDKGDYDGWEKEFGLTAKYWKRRNGSDHIMVYSEPFHGLKNHYSLSKYQGNYHYIHSQKQLRPPIAISVELSTTFVNMYPKCAAKNILMPYPNTDGRWFNGKLDAQAKEILQHENITMFNSPATLPAERHLAKQASLDRTAARPLAQYYSAGIRGRCKHLRKTLKQDYETCSSSFNATKSKQAKRHAIGMRHATFCPSPVGDSPSAKRMFDAILAGCIPVVVSSDFVWPHTDEIRTQSPSSNVTADDVDAETAVLKPSEFSIRMDTQDLLVPTLDPDTCLPKNETRLGLQALLDSIPAREIQKLRRGLRKAKSLYSYYKHDPNLPDEPLREGILPNGGAAHALVNALAERASGALWPACQEELEQPRDEDPMEFKC